MTIEKILTDGGYFQDDVHSNKYKKHLDSIYACVVDYGYIYKEIPSKDDQNFGRIATEEHFAIRVLESKRPQFEECMEDLNIALKTEMLRKDGKENLYYTFKSKNLPELKNITRGVVKTKQQQTNNAMFQSKGNAK